MTASDVVTVSQPVKKTRFSAALGFSYRPPFEDNFAERVPVIQAFALALANYSMLYADRHKPGLWGRIRRALSFPAQSPFRAVECGVYTGSSLVACAAMAQDAGFSFEMIGLDTFSGLPELSETDLSLAPAGAKYINTTLFSDTTIEHVQGKLVEHGLAESVHLRQGLFSQTLPALPEQRYHFVNIDCDLYEPHLECLRYFYQRMAPGGIVFFDDYHSIDYPMAAHAINEFMQDKPEKLIHLRFGDDAANRTKCFFIKY